MKQITIENIREFNLFKELLEKEHSLVEMPINYGFPLSVDVPAIFAEKYGY